MFRKNKNPFKKSKEEKMIGTIKYSGAKLHEKGVILEIEGLQPNQYVFLIIWIYFLIWTKVGGYRRNAPIS